MKKLSPFHLIGYATTAFVRNFGTLLGLTAPGLLVFVAAAVVGRLLLPPGAAAEAQLALGEAGIVLSLGMLATNLALIPAFTGWHRLLILGEARRENGRTFGWDGREWRYLRNLISIWLVSVGVNLVARLLAPAAEATPALAIVIVVTLLFCHLWIWAIGGMTLPAAALNDGRSFADIVNLLQGNVNRIGLALIGIGLLIGFVGFLLIMTLSAIGLASGSVYLSFVMTFLLYFIGLFAVVSVLSRAYALLAGAGSPPAPSL